MDKQYITRTEKRSSTRDLTDAPIASHGVRGGIARRHSPTTPIDRSIDRQTHRDDGDVGDARDDDDEDDDEDEDDGARERLRRPRIIFIRIRAEDDDEDDDDDDDDAGGAGWGDVDRVRRGRSWCERSRARATREGVCAAGARARG